MPVSDREKEPVVVKKPPNEIDLKYHDGRLEPAVGVHSYQVHRANRTDPPDQNHRGYTYNHQPMLGYCHGLFFVQYLAALHHEGDDRTETFLPWSVDGKNWVAPKIIFPAIEYDRWRYTIAHQRMGFYRAPNGRLLTLSFYGVPKPDDPYRFPNNGSGLGRAVREIYPDASLGPIYFFRYNPKAGYDEERCNQWYSHYSKSDDQGFIEACDALWKDKLVIQQMWEEHRDKDGRHFENMLTVCGDIPPQRFTGYFREVGAQYVRGVVEGNDTPPGQCLWVTYSMNKEDIWVSRIPVPVTGSVGEPVADDFSSVDSATLDLWNIYSGKWANIEAHEKSGSGYLRFRDEDPYDYAKAVRVFPECAALSVALGLSVDQNSSGRFEIDVMNPAGKRPVRICFDSDFGAIMAVLGDELVNIFAFTKGQEVEIQLDIDAHRQRFGIIVDGQTVVKEAPFAETVSALKRLEFRTGPHRIDSPPVRNDGLSGSKDLPGADVKTPTLIVDLAYVRTSGH